MRRLLVAVAVNLLLGVLAVVPFFLIWYALSNGPLDALGWTRGEPTENDGMLIWWLLAAVAFGGFASLWGLVNVWARRRVAVPGSRYWPACVVASLLPTCLILLR
jgi:hypothetical protein